MRTISDYIVLMERFLLFMFLSTFVVKTILYFSFEKYWDSLRFFYYSKVDLKMTPWRTLRNWRKRQNKMSAAMGILMMLFVMVYFFHQIVAIN